MCYCAVSPRPHHALAAGQWSIYGKACIVQAEDLETEKASLESSLEHKERLLKEAREEAMAARQEAERCRQQERQVKDGLVQVGCC